MSKLAILLAALALGIAGWQAYEASNLRDDLCQAQAETASLRADVDQLTRTLAQPGEAPIEVPPPLVVQRDESAGDGPRDATLAAKGASPEVVARAVRNLQDEVAELRQQNEDLEEKVGKNPLANFKRPTFIRDVAQAEKELDLTGGQRADVERIVDYTKRELEDLYNTRNADGKTWKEVAEVKLSSGGDFAVVMSNFAEIQKFRNETIPGSRETYGEAESRIRNAGTQDVRDVLKPEQREKFDKAHTQPLFGNSMGPMISIATSVTSTSEDPDD